MRPCSPVTAALLAAPPPSLRSADLFTFTLRDATIYRWTSYDQDLTVGVGGPVYSSQKPWLQRSRWSVANTMQVPTLEVRLLALNTAFAGGIDIKGQITNGLLDGATATLDRVFFPGGTTVIDDTVTTTLLGTQILAANALVTLAWWQATFEQGANDQACMGVACLDRTGTQIGVTQFAPLIAVPSDPTNTNGNWTQRQLAIVAPAGTATFRLYQKMHRFTGSNNDGYIDDITLNIGAFALTITNPGAEAGSIAGWTNDAGGLDVRTGGPAPHSGTYYFFGGTSTDTLAHQDVPLTVLSATYPGIRLFGGGVANVDVTGNEATINVKGKTNLLDQYAPRNLYQLGCEHAFCDVGCTLNRATFTASYTVGAAGASRTVIPWNGAAPANASNYRFGTVKFTSGACSGQSRTVRAADSSGLTLIHPLIGTPAAGDAFTAFEGCDKALSSGSGQDCTARSNTQNWRAFPYVPPADSAF